MADSTRLTVRPLKAGDVRTVARILAPQIRNLPSGKSADPESIGRDLFASMLEKNTDELWAWLADLAGMTSQELDDQPMTAPFDIIQKVLEDDDIGPFAKQLQSLLSKAQTGAGTK